MMRFSAVLLLVAQARAFAPPNRAHRALRTPQQKRPTAVAALPAIPGWVPSLPAGTGQVAGDLSLYTIKTLIAWGVPAFVVALVVFPLADAIFGGDENDKRSSFEGGAFGDEFALEDDQPRGGGLPFGPQKPRRAPNRPKAPQYLKVERLNERLESFEFSLEAASLGRYAARKARRTRRLGKAFADELGLAGLSDDTLQTVATAERDYIQKSTDARKNVLLARAQLRGLAAATNATSAENATAALPGDSGIVSKVKKLMPFSKEPKSNREDALNNLADATKESQEAELDYIGIVASHLPDDIARRRLGQLASEGRDGTLEGSLTNALDFLRNSTEAKRAYVLNFDGDTTASQTASLREEVTAILKTANVERGDTVVLKLTTGGGTVTGYGLAAAQLLRLKDAGLHLTVCVEQVAASGGYMMACCGDRIVASPFAVLGSIGVITDIPNAYERLKKEGIEFQTVTAGDFKRTITPTKKVTKEDLEKTTADVKEIFALFKKFVGGQRPKLDIDAVANGATWFGQDALDLHLCDELRTFDDVKLDLCDAGAEVLQVTYSPPPSSPLEALLQPAGSVDVSTLARLAKLALPVLSDLAGVDLKAGQPLALEKDADRYRVQDDRWIS